MLLRQALGRNRGFSSSSLDTLFREKIALGKSLPKLEDNGLKLQMYALYKQATDGANMQPKPGMFDFVGKAKWEAWMKLSSLSADEAKQQYCDLIDGLAKSSGMQSTAGSAPTPATPSSPNEGVKFTQSGGVTTLSTDANAPLDNDLVGKLTSAIKEAANDPVSKVLVLQLHPAAPSTVHPSAIAPLIQAIIAYPVPLGVVVHGPVHGLQVSLVGLADVVFSHERATFQVPTASAMPAAHALITKMGYMQANALLLLGAKLSADAAHRHGLVTDVFNGDVEAQAFSKFQHFADQTSDRSIKTILFRHQHKDALLAEFK
ncbi:hypothetical protein H310_04719 [Aphanomyces invadans]|uniref:ACB domain-containing protein n=1 Tax=Aphanomyces invadans TaxID=157072 RepID=A0A024UE34_9STRA|nr:hypothetical protein H310_04719 [Aphanomyces invadans]ETW04445.1 hypothetical protein H310_04719 [Aphanomyces invadans]|eukprot:XP_008867401.1 hypothetical protein H310_04719 [Aphanomyces invadans]